MNRRPRTTPALRIADRYAGIPLLWVVGALPKNAAPSVDSIRRVALFKSAAIGDTILMSGVIDDIRREWPQVAVTLVTGLDNAEAGALVAEGRARHLALSVREPWAALRSLRAEAFDVMVDFGSWPRVDAALTALSGARWRVGFKTGGQGRHFAYDHVAAHSAERHEMDNYRQLVGSLGIRTESPPVVTAPGVLALCRLPPAPYVVFHPWSGGYRSHLKEWPSARWVELAQRLNGCVRSVVLMGGAADVSRSGELAAQLTAAGVSAIDASGRYTLRETADLVGQSRYVVCVNSGIMHLAAALGVPTLSLEGPTSAARWGPIGPHTASVESTTPGCGYINLGDETSGLAEGCMSGISVEAVVAALAPLLRGA